MHSEVLEESIRMEIEKEAERYDVNYYELSPNVQSWLRALMIERLFLKDAPTVITPETGEEE